ncbi:AAA family ATPase [Asaia siamensis]
MSLQTLGPRLIVMGPSNSGKSTLSVFIGRLTGLPVVHLDLLRHEVGTFERLRPLADFHHDHARAITAPSWIIDGNYSSCLDQRLERATGVILLDVTTLKSLQCYIGRCLGRSVRHGGWGAQREPVGLSMVKHILGPTRPNRKRYRLWFASCSLPKLYLPTSEAVAAFCQREEARTRGGELSCEC